LIWPYLRNYLLFNHVLLNGRSKLVELLGVDLKAAEDANFVFNPLLFLLFLLKLEPFVVIVQFIVINILLGFRGALALIGPLELLFFDTPPILLPFGFLLL
jgi:hypothetical protein